MKQFLKMNRWNNLNESFQDDVPGAPPDPEIPAGPKMYSSLHPEQSDTDGSAPEREPPAFTPEKRTGKAGAGGPTFSM